MSCITGGAKAIFSKLLESRLKEVGEKTEQGRFVKNLLDEVSLMPICPMGKARGERKPSRWQMCIRKERAGKPFDPTALKKLAEKYRRGECP